MNKTPCGNSSIFSFPKWILYVIFDVIDNNNNNNNNIVSLSGKRPKIYSAFVSDYNRWYWNG